MSLEAIKLELVNYILRNQDQSLLEKVKLIFENEDQEIVARKISGENLTRSDYLESLLESEAEIGEGKFMTQEEVKKAVEKW
jgi:hydroxylamine reductase (hybrid-cluster protein)